MNILNTIYKNSFNIFNKTNENIITSKSQENLQEYSKTFDKEQTELSIQETPDLMIDTQPELLIKETPELMIDTQPELSINETPELMIDTQPELLIEETPELMIDTQPELLIEETPELLIKEDNKEIKIIYNNDEYLFENNLTYSKLNIFIRKYLDPTIADNKSIYININNKNINGNHNFNKYLKDINILSYKII